MYEFRRTASLPGVCTERGRQCRVAHIHSPLGMYGAERWTLTLVQQLDGTDVDSMVISVGAKPDSDLFHAYLVDAGVQAFHLPIPGKLNPRAVVAIRNLIVERCVDVVHTHGFKADVLGFLATRALDVALVSTIHGWTASEGWRIGMYETVSRLFLRQFDRLYPLSPALLEGLAGTGLSREKLKLILNAVDVSALDNVFERRQVRQRPDEPLRVLFVGRLCTPKGVIELLDGFSKARLPCVASLQIVGDGPERGVMENHCRKLGLLDRTNFHGALRDLRSVYRDADVVVLPSHSEGIPRVLMEALVIGVTAIGTDIPGIRQIITHGDTGLLVPVNSPDRIATALESVAQNPDASRKMALRGRQRVKAKFSATRQAADFRKEYQLLLAQRRCGRTAVA